MARTAGKRVSVRDALRFVGDRVPALASLSDIAVGDAPLTPEEREAALAALAMLRSPRIKATLGELVAELGIEQRWEKKLPSTRGGQPTKHKARVTLGSVVQIVEHHASSHAPKVTGLVLWLTGCAERICEPREGETAAKYLDRVTRGVEKLTRSR
jgi:hypothetical protein